MTSGEDDARRLAPSSAFAQPLSDAPEGADPAADSDLQAEEQEAQFLFEALELKRGARALDVGCGSGRRAVALAARGIAVTGVDVSRRLLEAAADRARARGVRAAFFEVDPRQMPFDDEFDVVMSLSRRGFGLIPSADGLVLRRMAESARPGGSVVVRAANAYFVVRDHGHGDLDADAGAVRGLQGAPDGGEGEGLDEWVPVYTPRELRLMAIGVGLVPHQVRAAAPSGYERRTADARHPELVLVARKPG